MYGESSPLKLGVAIMCAAALLTPLSDALAKILGDSHQVSAFTIAVIRFGLQTILMIPFMLAFGGRDAFKISRPLWNVLRGVLLAIGSVAFFAALKMMPLADAIAIFFAQPLIVAILAIVVLGEVANAKRIGAVSLGFIGALIVIQPNLMVLGGVALLPLLCAVCIAGYFLLGRYLSPGNSSVAMHFYTGLGALLTLIIFYPFGALTELRDFHFTLPAAGNTWLLLVAMSFLASAVHLMYIQAYRRAPAGLLAPFNYLEIVSAAAVGIGIFGEFPDFGKALGMCIIIASGLLLAWTDNEIKAKQLCNSGNPSGS